VPLRALAALAWGWLVVALPFITDAAVNVFLGLVLAAVWLGLTLAWGCVGAYVPGYLRDWRRRRKWLACGAPL
jgi:hypothetical protein